MNESLNEQSVTALLLGALSIAALHALIPSHWLAFALVGRAQRWTMRRTLIVTMLAGLGHALLTVVLGLILATVGKELLHTIPPAVEHAATAGLLIALGIYFTVSGLRNGGHCHSHGHDHDDHAGHSHSPRGLRGRLGEGPTVMGALVLGMTLSPCLDLLSVYVAASAVPWPILGAISIIMTVTTVGIMLLLVWLTLQGLQRVKLNWLERNEGVAVGAVLVFLGALLFFL